MCNQVLAVNGEFLLALFNGNFPACSFCGEYIDNSKTKKAELLEANGRSLSPLGKKDSEVSSVSVDGLIPPQSLLPSYWEGASRDPAALASSKQSCVLFLHNTKYHLFFTPESPGKNRENFFDFFFPLSTRWGKVAPCMSLQTSLLLLTLVARCLFVHLRKCFLIFVEIPLFLSSQCCCAFQSQCRVRRNTGVLS